MRFFRQFSNQKRMFQCCCWWFTMSWSRCWLRWDWTSLIDSWSSGLDGIVENFEFFFFWLRNEIELFEIISLLCFLWQFWRFWLLLLCWTEDERRQMIHKKKSDYLQQALIDVLVMVLRETVQHLKNENRSNRKKLIIQTCLFIHSKHPLPSLFYLLHPSPLIPQLSSSPLLVMLWRFLRPSSWNNPQRIEWCLLDSL